MLSRSTFKHQTSITWNQQPVILAFLELGKTSGILYTRASDFLRMTELPRVGVWDTRDLPKPRWNSQKESFPETCHPTFLDILGSARRWISVRPVGLPSGCFQLPFFSRLSFAIGAVGASTSAPSAIRCWASRNGGKTDRWIFKRFPSSDFEMNIHGLPSDCFYDGNYQLNRTQLWLENPVLEPCFRKQKLE